MNLSTLFLITSTFLLFASFMSFSISLLDGYLIVAILQCSSILMRYLSSETELQLFISSFLLPYTLGLIISARIFIKKEVFTGDYFLSKIYVKRTAIIISLLLSVSFVLKLYSFNLSQDNFYGQVSFGLSKQNPLIYGAQGLINTYCNAYLFFIFLNSIRKNILSKFNLFFLIILPTTYSIIEGLLIALKVSIFAYLTKALVPILKVFELYFLNQLRWRNLNLKRLLISQKFSRRQIRYLAIIVILFSFLILIFGFIFNSNVFAAIIFKIFVRSEGYEEAFNKLEILYSEYKYNFLYFLHPFLKVLGSQGYQAPIGTFMDSGFNPENWIGGPNIHFPLVIRIISVDAQLGFILNFIFAFFIGSILSKARNNIINATKKINSINLFSSIVFFQLFPLLFIEPSAWSHGMFFLTLIILIIIVISNISKSFAKKFFYSR